MNPVVLRPYASMTRPAFSTTPQKAVLSFFSADSVKFGNAKPVEKPVKALSCKDDLERKPQTLGQRVHNELMQLHSIFAVLHSDGVVREGVLPEYRHDIVHEALAMARLVARLPEEKLHPDGHEKLSKDATRLVTVLSGYARILNDFSFRDQIRASGQKIQISEIEIQELCGIPERVSRLNGLIQEISSPKPVFSGEEE